MWFDRRICLKVMARQAPLIFLLIPLLLFPGKSFAQSWPFYFWHDGKAVLETGDTIKGKIKYDPQNDIIQIDIQSHFESFTSRKVLFYEIFDVTSKTYRQFYALPYSPTGGYKTPSFFELLTEGKITLLAKENLEYKSYNTGFYYGSISRLVLVDKYFLLKENGSIEPILGKKNEFIGMMDTKENEVRKFMKTNKLGLERKVDIARVVAYYNSLFPK